ncbi:MAG: hypothetical protein MUO77_17800 [Anaerolineales bacterium]|nr:hypothetical protein [Anaerolineales bacterium]
MLEKQGQVYLVRDGDETELYVSRTELPLSAHVKVQDYSKATILIYEGEQQVGRVSLSSNSEIVFGVSSPNWISAWIKDGAGRFERRLFTEKGELSRKGFGTFNLTLGDKALIRELQTDFVVSAKDPTSVTVLDGSVIIDTFNQDGLLVQTGETITENANSSMVVDSGGNLQVQAVPSTPWWEDPFYQKPWPVDQSPLTNISQSWFLWGAIPGALCFGASFIVLIAGVFTKNKKISTLGTILIAVVICSTMIAAAFYAGSQLLDPEPANPIYDAPDIPESSQENPFPDVQPTAFFPTDIPPTLAPSVPTIVPTEMPHSQEVSAQPNIYNFAACTEPCLGDLSNRRASFPEKIEKIYLRFNYDWIPPGSDYARVWKNQGEEWGRYQCQWDGPESGVFETNIREPAGFRSGDWTMEIYVNGQLIAQETINIQGAWDFWEPAETMNKCK